ncbi:hypothetical protein [Clostridium sp. AF32-12BH]|uniref:hypothetical protein n=1 Tax=Clostridium sp. AF32-12BH TaxID=2292006 RepID=UPI000E48CCC3|nr:hypothetical protein [Clostridium sp. AF32-12BH]RHP47060.1 hypothetical protein DWZ40_09160 [Clostridium sp. AF32-12BH]
MVLKLFALLEKLALEQYEKKNAIHEKPEKRIYAGDGHSWLEADKIYVTDKIYIRIPTVGEILDNDQSYYSMAYHLTMSPFQYMVQLDDMHIDYTEITDYELFLLLFPTLGKGDLSLIFGDLDTASYEVKVNVENNLPVLYSKENGTIIDEFVYNKIADTLRKIHNLEKVRSKPGNEEAKRYLLEKERKKQKRSAKKPYSSYLEKLVLALVNSKEFKYNYEETMNLSIYKLNQSFKQSQVRIAFDNTMIGVYAGTVDTSKLADKSCLSWIQLD